MVKRTAIDKTQVTEALEEKRHRHRSHWSKYRSRDGQLLR